MTGFGERHRSRHKGHHDRREQRQHATRENGFQLHLDSPPPTSSEPGSCPGAESSHGAPQALLEGSGRSPEDLQMIPCSPNRVAASSKSITSPQPKSITQPQRPKVGPLRRTSMFELDPVTSTPHKPPRGGRTGGQARARRCARANFSMVAVA